MLMKPTSIAVNAAAEAEYVDLVGRLERIGVLEVLNQPVVRPHERWFRARSRNHRP